MGTLGKHWKLNEENKRNISIGKKNFFKNNPEKKPIPPSREGSKASEKTKRKMSISHKGKNAEEKNHNWKGGISQDYYRRIALENLPNLCEFCGSKNQLRVHHKDRNRKNNKLENLTIVCKSCHNKIHEKWRNLRPVKSGGGDTYVK